jgi:hypothetical protein
MEYTFQLTVSSIWCDSFTTNCSSGGWHWAQSAMHERPGIGQISVHIDFKGKFAGECI